MAEKASMNVNKSEMVSRLSYIDGIRGIAAVLVFFHHFACVFLPGLVFYDMANPLFETMWLNSPLNVLTNGNSSVQCFFVLSGFLIARNIYLKGEAALKSPVKTYGKFLRLVAPSVIFSAVLMCLGLMQHLDALKINEGLAYVNDFNNFSPSVLSIVKEIFFGVFISGSRYNSPLWTIRYEFFGSLLVMAISCYLSNLKKTRKTAYIIISILFIFYLSEFTPFIFGAFVYECVHNVQCDNSRLGRIVRWVSGKKILLGFVMVIGIYLSCTNLKLSGWWLPLRKLPYQKAEIFRALGVSLCLFGVEFIPFPKKLLSLKPIDFLGKISAYFYIFHWPIILSVGCGTYILLRNIPYKLAVLIAGIVSISVTCFAAFAYTKAMPLLICGENRIVTEIKKRLRLGKSDNNP